MSNYSEQVKIIIEQMPCNKIFVASELRRTHLSGIPEKTYYKILERLVRQMDIVHLTKGLYYRPNKNADGIIPIGEEDIIEYYVSEESGMIIGEGLFKQKGITADTADTIEILSNNMKEEKKHIGRIEVRKAKMVLDSNTIPMVETLEILQNYNKVKHVNKNRLLAYIKRFSEQYSDEVAEYVIERKKYKKSTIAFLERMLTWYGVENSLGKYLSTLSEYKIPTIEQLQTGIPAKVQGCLDKYVIELKNIYQSSLNKVILYGSYARGDFDEDSDIDIMILLNIPDMEIKDYRHQLSQLTYDFNVNYNLDIKPIAKSEEQFMQWVETYPFYANVKKDGVELYGAA